MKCHRFLRHLSFAVLAWVLSAGYAAAAENLPGQWLKQAAAKDSGIDRDYALYVPSGASKNPLPLLVMLHGCGLRPDSFAEITGMNALAEKEKFLVLYPAQKLAANPMLCWNWFLPENEKRGAGEPAIIVNIVEVVSRSYPVDRARVYVAGLSGGASMSATLAACYPDVFAAAAVHSGTMYKSATTLGEATGVMLGGRTPDPVALGAEAWRCSGKRLPMPMVVVQGVDDSIVKPKNGDAVVRQFLVLNDWADDGQANGSVIAERVVEQATVPGGHGYSVARYGEGKRTLVEYVEVLDMGHAWSGGREGKPFSDPKGPNASRLMWDFFRRFARGP